MRKRALMKSNFIKLPFTLLSFASGNLRGKEPKIKTSEIGKKLNISNFYAAYIFRQPVENGSKDRLYLRTYLTVRLEIILVVRL